MDAGAVGDAGPQLVTIDAETVAIDGASARIRFVAPRAQADASGWTVGSACWLPFGDDSRLVTITGVTDTRAGEGSAGVAAIVEHGADEFVELLLADGTSERVTPSQRLWSLDRSGWVMAPFLRDGERLLGRDGERILALAHPVRLDGVAWDVDLAETDAFVLATSGLVVHNCDVSHLRRGYSSSPALKGDPYHPDVVANRNHPEHRPNPAHDPHSSSYNPNKTPEPHDSASAYQNAVRGGMSTWYAAGEGGVYRYFGDNNGGAHFSAIVDATTLPRDTQRALGLK